jgi:gas vesicle protein
MTTHAQEFSSPDRIHSTKLILKAALIGRLAGTGTMLFLAPGPRRKLRARIQKKSNELREPTTDTVKGAVSQVISKSQQIKDNVLEKAEDF